MLHIGSVLDQRYRIDYVVKQGGMGTVYGAHDLRLDRPCAVKAVRVSVPEEAVQIEREARVLGRLCHPHLPAIYDCLEQGDTIFVVMQMIPGEDLEAVTSRGGPPGCDTLVGWALQLAEVVQYLHEQSPPVIHRDIKPANIRLAPHGQIYLVDFGIVKLLDGVATVTAAKAASVPYAPIEQIQDDSHTDQQSDIYAFGATLYRLLTTKLPPSCIDRLVGSKTLPPIREYNSAVPERLEALVLRCMELYSFDRPASMAEVIVELHAARGGAVVPRPGVQTVPIRPSVSLPVRGRPVEAPPEARFAFDAGKMALDAGDPASAGQYFTQAIERQRTFAEAYAARAAAAQQLGKLEIALRDLNVALSYQPDTAGWYLRRGLVNKQLQDIAAAIADFSTALDLNPELNQAYWERAQLRRETGDARGYLHDLDRLLQIAPDHREARLARAYARMEQQLWQAALPDCTVLVQSEPQAAAGYLLRAKVYAKLGDTTRALRDLGAALQIDSHSAEAHFQRGRLLQRSGDRQAALRNFNLALANDPEHLEARYRRAQLYRLQGPEREALAEFRGLLTMLRARAPGVGTTEVARRSAQRPMKSIVREVPYLMQTGGIEKARRYLHQNVAAFSDDDDEDLEERAALFERVGQVDAALDDLERAVKLLRDRGHADAAPAV